MAIETAEISANSFLNPSEEKPQISDILISPLLV